MPEFKKFHLDPIKKNGKIYRFSYLEQQTDFTAKRLYFIFVDDSLGPTGQHCHLEEKEVFIMTQGTCVAIIDRGNGKEDITLETGDAIYVPNYVWHGFKDFSEGAIITALSSTNYRPDRSDYIEDYDEYLKVRDEHLKKSE